MKKTMSMMLATLIILVFMASSTQAQSVGLWNKFNNEIQQMFHLKFLDGTQGYGDCTGFVDADGDGVCDNCGSGDCDGTGGGLGDGTGEGGGIHGLGDGTGDGGGERGDGECDGSGRP